MNLSKIVVITLYLSAITIQLDSFDCFDISEQKQLILDIFSTNQVKEFILVDIPEPVIELHTFNQFAKIEEINLSPEKSIILKHKNTTDLEFKILKYSCKGAVAWHLWHKKSHKTTYGIAYLQKDGKWKIDIRGGSIVD